MNAPVLWYRYTDQVFAPFYNGEDEPRQPGTLKICLSTFRVTKVTPKGVRLDNGRFVQLDSRKRFACPTKVEALASFKARKEQQVSILYAQLQRAEKALKLIDRETP